MVELAPVPKTPDEPSEHDEAEIYGAPPGWVHDAKVWAEATVACPGLKLPIIESACLKNQDRGKLDACDGCRVGFTGVREQTSGGAT